MAPHPLLPAVLRASTALVTVTDLISIAQTRKTPKGRSDARQAALYRAIVAAAVGAVEEAVEALVTQALRAQQVPDRGMRSIEATVARLMQTPNSSEIRKLFESFLDWDPTPNLRVHLRTSVPALRDPKHTDGRTSRGLWTIYDQYRLWDGADAAEVLDRFVRIRHSFAHQDSSVALLTKTEAASFRTRLGRAKAADPTDVAFVERLNATCAMRVWDQATPGSDPVESWRLHETQALNAFLAAAGIITSLTNGLLDWCEAELGLARDAYVPVVLMLEEGAWQPQVGAALDHSSTPGVEWGFAPYKPNSRLHKTAT